MKAGITSRRLDQLSGGRPAAQQRLSEVQTLYWPEQSAAVCTADTPKLSRRTAHTPQLSRRMTETAIHRSRADGGPGPHSALVRPAAAAAAALFGHCGGPTLERANKGS